MPATLEEKIDPKSHEIHVGLDIPRATARQIHRWAREQSWPEGTQLEEPREYHVTLLYSTEGREHKDAWWIEHLERAEVRLKGLTAFPAQEKGYAYVLLLDAPEVAQKAQEMQEKAEAHGLPITQFDGGYKPHITVAYGPSNRLSGIKAPEFQFDIGPSSVSPTRPKNSSAPPKPPNYREGTEEKRCGTCKMFWQGNCWGYGNREVRGGAVCDSWSPEKKRSAYNPEEVQILDHLSLQNVAANLHYKFEEGGMDALGATDYAKRLLKLIGYPEDEITVQAALQAWQKMYPEDRLLEGGVTPKITMAIGPEHPDYDPYYDEMVEGWHRDQIPLYHTAPSAVREQILREGLKVADPNAPGNEPGVYVEGDPGMVKDYWGGYKGITDRDIWQIDQRHVKRLMPDYRGQAAYIPHDVPPEALTLHTEGGSPEKFAASRRDLTYSFSPLFGDTAFGKDSAVRYTGGNGQIFGVRPGDNRPLAGGGNRSTAFGWEPRQSPSGGTHQTGQGQTSGAHSQSSLRTRSYGFDAPAGETSQFAREVLGPWESKGVVALHNEDPDKLHLHTVELPSDLRGQGYGHRFMNHVKAYSDAHGKPLVIDPVTNPQFFNQFDWLTPNQQQTRYEYSPEGSSTIPSEVNSPEDHWPDVGGADSPRDHGVQVSNEWVYTN